MRVTGWWGGNPDHPVYGLAVSKSDRDRLFDPSWEKVELLLGESSEPISVELTEAFWRECSELCHPAIRIWFQSLGVTPWPKGLPPSFAMRSTNTAAFTVRPIERRSLL